MAAKPKVKKVTNDMIISLYMDTVLEHEVFPKSVYKFCKNHNIKEADFYQHFGSFEGLQKAIWENFYLNTVSLLHKNKAYGQYGNREKMLSFFFTFFENLTLNRSYVLFSLKEHKNLLKGLEQLKGLRKLVKEFATSLIDEGNETKTLKITKHNPKLFSEGAWLQFMFLLKFWMDDTSPAFEKTDMAIEKSVNTIFDVFQNTPLDSILDFGKFLYKEHIA